MTNEVAGTGWSPKVDSAGVKFQVYLSHCGVQKPKNGRNVYGDTQNTLDAQGGGRVKLRSCVNKWSTLNGVGSLGAMKCTGVICQPIPNGTSDA